MFREEPQRNPRIDQTIKLKPEEIAFARSTPPERVQEKKESMGYDVLLLKAQKFLYSISPSSKNVEKQALVVDAHSYLERVLEKAEEQYGLPEELKNLSNTLIQNQIKKAQYFEAMNETLKEMHFASTFMMVAKHEDDLSGRVSKDPVIY
jgi:hypothetical protein